MLKKSTRDSIVSSLKSKISNRPFDKIFDLFEKILFFHASDKEIEGVTFYWETSLDTIYNENLPFSEQKKVGCHILNIEPFLKKILFVIDEEKFKEIVSSSKGLAAVMKSLGIDPFNKSNPDYLKIAYELRNVSSHQAAEYSRMDFYENVEACIITVLDFVYQNYGSLMKVNYNSASFDVNDYMNEIVEAFKCKNKKYINLNGSEEIKSINTMVLEDLNLDDNEINEQPREGEIDCLRKTLIPEKKMLLVAEAGMGKTTTIEYLAYIDAKEKIEDIGSKIPVLLYLNLMIDPKLTIIDYISKKLSISVENVKELLNEGEINLFLDGLNEIPNITDLKNARISEINHIVDTFKNTFVIISTRPQTNNLILHVPKFNLLSLDNLKQDLFIEKNCKDKETKSIVRKAINESYKIRKVVKTPLFLSVLIKVVYLTKRIPSSEGELIKVFMNSLFEREVSQKNNTLFDIRKANYLLRYFAYVVKEKYKANSGVIESEVIDSFGEKMKLCSFKVDALDYLSIFIDLGILSEQDGLYYFYHESYQDYFYSEEIRSILED